jgi:hypothetical protein
MKTFSQDTSVSDQARNRAKGALGLLEKVQQKYQRESQGAPEAPLAPSPLAEQQAPSLAPNPLAPEPAANPLAEKPQD